MCGFDANRFAALSKTLEADLTCGICLNIYKDAVIIGCGHTFCRDCIELTEQHHNPMRSTIKCPECRRVFTAVNHTRHLFRKNLKIDQIVGKLKVKCDFEVNGCEAVVELYDLSYHLKHCPFNKCQTCGHLTGDPLKHSCVELLKKDNDQKDKDLIKLMNALKFLEITREPPLSRQPLIRGFSQPTAYSEPIGSRRVHTYPGARIRAVDPHKVVEILKDTEKSKDPEEPKDTEGPNDLSKDD